jgi:hypothetical protein
MKEIAFSIPLSGVVRIDENQLVVTVDKVETIVTMAAVKGFSVGEGRTLFDVVLESARELVREKGSNRFRAAEVYHRALERYPELKRNSFVGHVVASAPNHPSYKHFTARRDYLSYSEGGTYRLEEKYLEETPRNRLTGVDRRYIHREVKQ